MLKAKVGAKAKSAAKPKARATSPPDAAGVSPEARLTMFIDKFDENNRKLIRETRAAMRKRYPNAVEMVYDNYNFFVIGYGASDRASKAIFSIAASAKGVALCFLFGATLKDPGKILRGSGNQVRSIRLPSAATLDEQPVKDLMTAAVAQSPEPFLSRGKGELIIKSVSAKQRPRRRQSGRAVRCVQANGRRA